jgi:hypothetical protein
MNKMETPNMYRERVKKVNDHTVNLVTQYARLHYPGGCAKFIEQYKSESEYAITILVDENFIDIAVIPENSKSLYTPNETFKILTRSYPNLNIKPSTVDNGENNIRRRKI